MEPLLAAEAMKNMHGVILAGIAVVGVIAGLVLAVRSLRFRRRSAEQSERDQGRGA